MHYISLSWKFCFVRSHFSYSQIGPTIIYSLFSLAEVIWSYMKNIQNFNVNFFSLESQPAFCTTDIHLEKNMGNFLWMSICSTLAQMVPYSTIPGLDIISTWLSKIIQPLVFALFKWMCVYFNAMCYRFWCFLGYLLED